MEDVRHLARASLILCALLLSFLFARSRFIPESYGEYGRYRFDSVHEEMALVPLYQDSASCGECHPERFSQRETGKHQTVECEICHGPGKDHLSRTAASQGEMELNSSRDLCLRCHRDLEARRESFPQINVASHFDMLGLDPEEESVTCIDCHDPHNPEM